MIDAIIISHAKTQALRNLTEGVIKSLRNDKDQFNIIVVEGNPDVKYRGALAIPSCDPFNYNRACNLAIPHLKGEYHTFLNNDLILFQGWAKRCIKAMEKDNLGCASAWCSRSHPGLGVHQNTGVHVGHIVRRHVAGWAFIMKAETLDAIGGKFDEGVNFHYSDDLYIAQLLKAGIRHGLVTNARIDHIESQTLHTLPQGMITEMTQGQRDAYVKRLDEGYKGVNIRKKLWQK